MTARQAFSAIVYPLKVIVSPFRAFREIAQNPNVKGIIMELALFLAATIGAQYVSASKILLTIDSQPTSLLASNMFAGYLLISVIEMAIVFFASWFVYGGVLLLFMRVLGEKVMLWRPFLILAGYVFSVFIIRMGVTAVLISTLPELPLGISTWPPATVDDSTIYIEQINALWAPTLASRVASIFIWVVYAWFVMLGAVAVHASREIAWRKALMISLAAYLTNFALSSFLPVMI